MYNVDMNLMDTERAIKALKDYFENGLAERLVLTRVSAPLFVLPETGLNDNLNGVERPVDFDILETGKRAEIVHSLAKWKRHALKRYDFKEGTGLYTDMNAIRRDETCDALHSIYVDQYDWEKVIHRGDRTVDFLKSVVRDIYSVIRDAQQYICAAFPAIGLACLPRDIAFVTAQELLDRYPDKTPKEREKAIAEEYGAVFIMQIGGKLSDGSRHDGRAPDYDDWSLNGDIILYYDVLDTPFEISSMGIRVDEKSLLSQLNELDAQDRLKFDYHKQILDGSLPLTVGGGIGQSRLCMFMLRKRHIGEVQASVWPDKTYAACEKEHITLL